MSLTQLYPRLLINSFQNIQSLCFLLRNHFPYRRYRDCISSMPWCNCRFWYESNHYFLVLKFTVILKLELCSQEYFKYSKENDTVCPKKEQHKALCSFRLISLATNRDIIYWKGGIHSFVWSTKTFLYDIREPRYKQIKMGYHISKCLNFGQS